MKDTEITYVILVENPSLGCANTQSGVPKVLKYMVIVNFPIHLDPRTSPSEKISIFFQIYYWCKPVEVLLYDLLYSDFGRSRANEKTFLFLIRNG